MSLKVFHLVFIALSILMAAGVGGWAINRYLVEGSGSGLALGVGFFLIGTALVVYGVGAVRKFRELGR